MRPHAVGAEPRRRMGIAAGRQPLLLRAPAAAPALAVADEEALLGRQPVDRLELLAARRLAPGPVGQEQTAEVGHVLAQGELAVDLDVVDDGIAAVLLLDAVRPRLELARIPRPPPVAQVAAVVELTALVVEAVGE